MKPLLASFLPLLAAPALAQDPTDGTGEAEIPFRRPAFSFLRQNEDWSDLRGRDTSATGDPFDPWKFVELSDDGRVWASFGGSAQGRIEVWDEFLFGAPPGVEHDDVFAVGRVRAHGDVHFGDDLRVFVEIKSAMVTDRELVGGKRTLDEDPLALQQLFADYTVHVGDDADLRLRIGRQMLSFGKQRLVSPLPWGNTLRTWEGVSAMLDTGPWSVTAFATQFVPVDSTSFNERDDGNELHGVYATRSGLPGGTSLDLYWLRRERDAVAFNGTAGPERRNTFGAHAWGRAAQGRVDWDVELAHQNGSIGPGNIDAAMLAAQVGWRVAEDPGAPRVWAGLDWASGDEEPGGDSETFDQLFPLGHAFLGLIDAVGRQNILDTSFGANFPGVAGWNLGIANHVFRAADRDDAIYNVGGGVLRAGGTYDSRDIGFGTDLTAVRKLGAHSTLLLGYSRFFTGDALESSGPAEDSNFVYAQIFVTL